MTDHITWYEVPGILPGPRLSWCGVQTRTKGKQLGHRRKGGTEMAGTIDEARLGEFMGQMAAT